MDAFSLSLNTESTGADLNSDATGGLSVNIASSSFGDKVGSLHSTATSKSIDQGLSLRQRLRKSADFQDAFDQKSSFVGKYVVMLQRHCDDSSLRVGVISSKKTLRRAVDRNRAKRLMREAYRINRHRFFGKLDVVLIARRPIAKATLALVEKDLMRLASKAGMLSEKDS